MVPGLDGVPPTPHIRITTLSGEDVTAPLERWVQALILRLPPGELVALLRMVDARPPLLLLPPPFESQTVPADPDEFLRRA